MQPKFMDLASNPPSKNDYTTIPQKKKLDKRRSNKAKIDEM
jgi:hypothetical protein